MIPEQHASNGLTGTVSGHRFTGRKNPAKKSSASNKATPRSSLSEAKSKKVPATTPKSVQRSRFVPSPPKPRSRFTGFPRKKSTTTSPPVRYHGTLKWTFKVNFHVSMLHRMSPVCVLGFSRCYHRRDDCVANSFLLRALLYIFFLILWHSRFLFFWIENAWNPLSVRDFSRDSPRFLR